MKTGPVNEQLRSLVAGLESRGHRDGSRLLLRLASELGKATRNRRVVNLSRINRFTKAGDTIVVPGKVLASGELDHAVTIAAWRFSAQAIDKIQKSKSRAIPLADLVSDGVKDKRIRVLG